MGAFVIIKVTTAGTWSFDSYMFTIQSPNTMGKIPLVIVAMSNIFPLIFVAWELKIIELY